MPIVKEGNVLLRIKRVGICGTDFHAFEGTQPYFSYPRILGHEIAATVESTGSTHEFTENEPVTLIPYFHCGVCLACTSGLTNCCSGIQVCGVHIDGGMVEYLSVPSGSLIRGEGLSYDELALVEPLAISKHGVYRAQVKENEHVLIVGAGPIGLGLIEFATLAGGHVTVLDLNSSRLAFCKSNFEHVSTINPTDQHYREQMLDITNGNMFSVVIDATGSQKAMNQSFDFLAHGARYVLVGLQKDQITFNHPEFHKREVTLMSSRNATRSDFKYVIECLRKKLLRCNAFITHRAHFDRVADLFGHWLKPEAQVIKAMVDFE